MSTDYPTTSSSSSSTSTSTKIIINKRRATSSNDRSNEESNQLELLAPNNPNLILHPNDNGKDGDTKEQEDNSVASKWRSYMTIKRQKLQNQFDDDRDFDKVTSELIRNRLNDNRCDDNGDTTKMKTTSESMENDQNRSNSTSTLTSTTTEDSSTESSEKPPPTPIKMLTAKESEAYRPHVKTALDHEIEKIIIEMYLADENDPRYQPLRQLFRGVCIYVNGYTDPVASTLYQIMRMTGGQYSLIFEASRTTHTVANQISQAQLKSDRAKRTTVRPGWIVDSLRQRKLLPVQDYLIAKPSNGIKDFFIKINDNSSSTTKSNLTTSIVESSNSVTSIPETSNLVTSIPGPSNSVTSIPGPSNLTKLSSSVPPPPRLNRSNSPELLVLLSDDDDDDDEEVQPPKQTSDTSVAEPRPSATTTSTKTATITEFNSDNFIPESLSQIDPELLAAMPDDIRFEITGYMNSKKINNSTNTSSSGNLSITNKSSSSSSMSFTKINPKKKSPKKTTINVGAGPSGRRQASSKSSKKQPKIDMMIRRQIDRAPFQKLLDIYSGKRSMKDDGGPMGQVEPNLCGKTKFSDICQLFHEWILTEPKLQDHDVGYVLRYFSWLIDQNRIHEIRPLLGEIGKFILERERDQRNLNPDQSSRNNAWRTMFCETFKAFLQSEPGPVGEQFKQESDLFQLEPESLEEPGPSFTTIH